MTHRKAGSAVPEERGHYAGDDGPAPAVRVTAEAALKLATVALAAKLTVPTLLPFFRTSKCACAVAEVPATAGFQLRH